MENQHSFNVQEEFKNMLRILGVLVTLLKRDVYEDTGIVYKKGGIFKFEFAWYFYHYHVHT